MEKKIEQSPGRGRPRSGKVHQAILEAALAEVASTGFRALKIDDIAARAGAGKTTIYRRWPNKAAVVMDAFLSLVGPGAVFPYMPRATDSIRQQMRLQGKLFRGKYGALIKSLLGEAQFDPELAEAFRDRWIQPRRLMTRGVLQEAIRQGDLDPAIDIEAAIDLFYAPLYYRLQIGSGPIDDAFTDKIFAMAMQGLRSTKVGPPN
jgi:AcrR family transcriptional regulator